MTFEVGDVVYAEGSSALLGDVIAVEDVPEGEYQLVTVRWRGTTTTEDSADLRPAEEVRPEGPETDRGGLIGQQPY